MTNFDVSNEKSNYVTQGIQWKYKPTMLVMVSNKCLTVCEHCFRKRLFENSLYSEDGLASVDDVLKIASENKEIRSVLLTGGDSFLADYEYLKDIVLGLNKIPHIHSIRFGSRAVVQNPFLMVENQIDKLVQISNKVNYIITHPLIPDDLSKGLANLTKDFSSLAIFKAQIPLLKGVNDDPKKLANLWEELSKINITPYYTFQCRPTEGNRMFTMTFSQSLDVFEAAKKISSGVTKTSRLIMSCDDGKLELVARYNNQILLKYHQARNPDNQEKIILAPENAIWYSNNRFVY